MEGVPYLTIARKDDINYRNVYDWINNYRKYPLDSIKETRE